MRRSLFAYSLAILLSISGCATNGGSGISKTEGGTAIGALAGALFGASVSGKHDKAQGALMGALIGGLIGHRIGAMLDEQDRQRLQASTQKSILTGSDQSWVDRKTGVQAKTMVKETQTPPQERTIPVLKDKVKEVPPLQFIGEDYAARDNANVRGGPATDYKVVGQLHRGNQVHVVGKVIDHDWYMISNNGIGSGFVAANLLKPLGKATIAPKAGPAGPTTPAGADVAQASVAASSTCRVVTQQVTTKDGRTANQDVKACRGPNGWEIVPT